MLQFHILSFEGPDGYCRIGGLASRVSGLAATLSENFETHLWFVGDANAAGHERKGRLHLHRWCQWISRFHPAGVYDGEHGKEADYAASLPPFLLANDLMPHLRRGGRATVLAEEWHTVNAVLHLDWLLKERGLRDRVDILWNANNTFGFDSIDWHKLSNAATVTTVSRYMKHCMRPLGVNALVIPNGLDDSAFDVPNRGAVQAIGDLLQRRPLLVKMARWDPDKRWPLAIDILSTMKAGGAKPLLVARGGLEAHGQEVLTRARAQGLRIVERTLNGPGPRGLLGALAETQAADLVLLKSHVDPGARRVLFRAADAVLANSSHEPFGLVGLEVMAASGLACTGSSGEDYVVPGQNALVLETDDPREFVALYDRLNAADTLAIRRAGRKTALEYSWPRVIDRALLPRVDHTLRWPTVGARPRSSVAPKSGVGVVNGLNGQKDHGSILAPRSALHQ